MPAKKPPPALPNIGKPAQRALASIGVHDLKGVTKHSKNHLSELHGVGPKALGILEAALKKHKLKFHA